MSTLAGACTHGLYPGDALVRYTSDRWLGKDDNLPARPLLALASQLKKHKYNPYD